MLFGIVGWIVGATILVLIGCWVLLGGCYVDHGYCPVGIGWVLGVVGLSIGENLV